MNTKGHLPDYAQRFFKKTGKQLSVLIREGADNETIKMEFFKAGLHRPSEKFLENFRKDNSDKKIVGNFISDEFRKFLREELGMDDVTDTAILDSIILLGFRSMTAGGGGQVTVGEVLKALELKDKYRGATPESISEKVKQIFAGKNPLPAKPDAAKEEKKKNPVTEPTGKIVAKPPNPFDI